MTDIYTHFVRESNKIEGIIRTPTKTEIYAHRKLLEIPTLAVSDLEKFVMCIQPGAVLRDKPGRDVRVGAHLPPPGHWNIRLTLQEILKDIAEFKSDPYNIHCRYETLHPFMDGNGRSGRALWLWMMARQGSLDYALELGFLHGWYYQTLRAFHG